MKTRNAILYRNHESISSSSSCSLVNALRPGRSTLTTRTSLPRLLAASTLWWPSRIQLSREMRTGSLPALAQSLAMPWTFVLLIFSWVFLSLSGETNSSLPVGMSSLSSASQAQTWGISLRGTSPSFARAYLFISSRRSCELVCRASCCFFWASSASRSCCVW